MSPAASLHNLISNTAPGYGPLEKGCFPCLVVSGRTGAVSPCTVPSDCQILSKVKAISLNRPSKQASLMCKAGPGGSRSNPDLPRQNRHSFSRNWNRQQEEWDDETSEESDVMSSRNGRVPRNNPKFQATMSVGRREKEIVELFKKVQAKLRERSASKEERVTEAREGQRKESEAVDSLLNLLKKHSGDQGKGKAKSGSDRPSESGADELRQSRPLGQDKSRSFLTTDRIVPSDPIIATRPPSSFQRRSPVPTAKFEPSPSRELTRFLASSTLYDKRLKNNSPREPEPETEQQLDTEPEIDTYSSLEEKLSSELLGGASLDAEFDDEDDEVEEDDDNAEDQASETALNLREMKVPELRELAKARGHKAVSKKKRDELLALLGDG